MANTKITDFTAWATPIATDVVPVVDVGTTTTKKITYANLLGNMPVGTAASPTLRFTGDANSGPYWIGADNWGFAMGGAKALDIKVGQIGIPDGTVAAPGLAPHSDTDCGLYRIGADNLGLAVNGAKVLDIGTGGLSVVTALLPNTTDGAALGSATLMWSDLFLASAGVINFNNGNMTVTHSAGVLNFSAGIIGINENANANMTTGLVINQGAADNHIVSLKSSDVAHGVTTIMETDTYGALAKHHATEGGLHITGIRASTGSPGVVIRAIGTAVTGDPPTTSTSANAIVNCALINGTGVQAVGATNPMFSVQNNDTNEFVVMGDGELYSNQSATVGTFDEYDDAVMCGDLSYLLASQYSKIVAHNRALFSRIGIVTDGGMVSLTKMHQLELGAINQVGQRLNKLEQALMERIQLLQRQVLLLQGG